MAVTAGPSIIRWTAEENEKACELATARDYPTLVDRFRNLLADLREAKQQRMPVGPYGSQRRCARSLRLRPAHCVNHCRRANRPKPSAPL